VEQRILLEKFPFLRNQNLIGTVILLVAVSFILGSIYLWELGTLHVSVMIFWIAFWNSILHELEHDLIHDLYFKKNKYVKNLFLFIVWFFRPLTLNPWIRRYWHRFHHQHSGQVIDIEERGVTNGEKWSLKRLLITHDLVLGFLLRFKRIRSEIKKEYKEGRFSASDMRKLRQTVMIGLLPFGIPLTFLFYAWVLINIYSSVMGYEMIGSMNISQFNTFVNPVMFIWVLPNFIRQFCLHFITSNMHYYGDIAEGDIVAQTQVLNVWWTWPFQLFCFNFGATHAIHHFYVDQTFYNRQLIMRKAHLLFKAEGIRFNDIASIRNANRYSYL